MRYIAIVYTWNDGRIDYVGVWSEDWSSSSSKQYIDGKLIPAWLQERAAMLRLCDVGSGGTIGEKFSNNISYVHLNQQEYDQLINLTGAEDENETGNQR